MNFEWCKYCKVSVHTGFCVLLHSGVFVGVDYERKINVQKLTSLNLVLRTTKLTHVKPQISKFKAEMSCQVGFNVSRRLYSWAFVKRVKSFVHVNISFESNNSTVEIVQGLLGLNVKRGWSVQNVNNTVASNTVIYRDYTITCTNDLTRLTNAHE